MSIMSKLSFSQYWIGFMLGVIVLSIFLSMSLMYSIYFHPGFLSKSWH